MRVPIFMWIIAIVIFVWGVCGFLALLILSIPLFSLEALLFFYLPLLFSGIYTLIIIKWNQKINIHEERIQKIKEASNQENAGFIIYHLLLFLLVFSVYILPLIVIAWVQNVFDLSLGEPTLENPLYIIFSLGLIVEFIIATVVVIPKGGQWINRFIDRRFGIGTRDENQM